jgi:hypothetical protein
VVKKERREGENTQNQFCICISYIKKQHDDVVFPKNVILRSVVSTKAYLDSLLQKETPPLLEFHWWPAETQDKFKLCMGSLWRCGQ